MYIQYIICKSMTTFCRIFAPFFPCKKCGDLTTRYRFSVDKTRTSGLGDAGVGEGNPVDDPLVN